MMASSSDFYYWIKIPDTTFNDDIIKLIDSSKDEMQHTTNVKAKMTNYHLGNDDRLNILKTYILDFAKYATKERFNSEKNFVIDCMWGMAYEENNHTIEHVHWPATWSACYYINSPKNSPGLYFTDLKEELPIENGMLVLFPGWVRHGVKKQKFEGTRYAVAANLYLKEHYEIQH